MSVEMILRQATRKPDEPLNVLCFNTHERYETHLAQTGHNFYAWNAPHMKKWKTQFAQIPSNYVQLNEELGNVQIPPGVEIDVILSQQKFYQYQTGVQLARMLDVPLISFEHTLPIREWPRQRFDGLRSMRGDANIFLSEFSKNAWEWEDQDNTYIIPAAVDTEFFTPGNESRENTILSIVNDWKERDYFCGYTLWTRTANGLPTTVRGINKGLSVATSDIFELRDVYRKSRIFYNTSLWSSCPYTLLEAMACGCAIVTTGTTMLPSIIQDGVNGFISNDENVLREKLIYLLENEDVAAKLGESAAKSVREQFSLCTFIDNWNNLFKKVVQ